MLVNFTGVLFAKSTASKSDPSSHTFSAIPKKPFLIAICKAVRCS